METIALELKSPEKVSIEQRRLILFNKFTHRYGKDTSEKKSEKVKFRESLTCNLIATTWFLNYFFGFLIILNIEIYMYLLLLWRNIHNSIFK